MKFSKGLAIARGRELSLTILHQFSAWIKQVQDELFLLHLIIDY